MSTIFVCQGARLLAAGAALEPACNSLGLLQAPFRVNKLGDNAWTVRNSYSLQYPRAFCNGSREFGIPVERKLERDTCDSSRVIIMQQGHFSRVNTIALSFSKSQRSTCDHTQCNSRLPFYQPRRLSGQDKLGTVESILFTSGSKVCVPRYSITTMLANASSTLAAKKPETGAGEEASAENKGEAPSSPPPPSSSESSEPPEKEGGPPPTKTQQLKKVFKEYGAVGVSFHVAISLMSLGMFYVAVSSGIDMAAVLCKLGFSETVVQSKMAAGTSTFVLAYAVHKLFAPVRISITLVSVPLIVRYFRKTGLFKPPTP